MTHVIRVLEPGKSRSKLYAGSGALTSKRIHAKVYRQDVSALQAWCDELTRDNPGYRFTLEKLVGDADPYREAAPAAS